MQLHPIHEALIPYAQPNRIPDFMRCFRRLRADMRGDTFMGVMVPTVETCQRILRRLGRKVRLSCSPHSRGTPYGTFHLMRYYGKERKQATLAMINSCFEGINNWDLVDTCAYKIFGQHAFNTNIFLRWRSC